MNCPKPECHGRLLPSLVKEGLKSPTVNGQGVYVCDKCAWFIKVTLTDSVQNFVAGIGNLLAEEEVVGTAK